MMPVRGEQNECSVESKVMDVGNANRLASCPRLPRHSDPIFGHQLLIDERRPTQLVINGNLRFDTRLTIDAADSGRDWRSRLSSISPQQFISASQ
jgi:hypothetical protein